METRRLRLYVVAYLRGLLKPYYEHGYSSLVREELVINALSTELDNEALKQIQLVEGMMAQHVKDKSEHFSGLYDRINQFRHSLELAPDIAEAKARERSVKIEALTTDPEVNKLIAKYKEMEAAGQIEELRKRHEENVAAIVPEFMEDFNPGQKLAYSTNKELERSVEIPDSDVIENNTATGI